MQVPAPLISLNSERSVSERWHKTWFVLRTMTIKWLKKYDERPQQCRGLWKRFLFLDASTDSLGTSIWDIRMLTFTLGPHLREMWIWNLQQGYNRQVKGSDGVELLHSIWELRLYRTSYIHHRRNCIGPRTSSTDLWLMFKKQKKFFRKAFFYMPTKQYSEMQCVLQNEKAWQRASALMVDVCRGENPTCGKRLSHHAKREQRHWNHPKT